MKRQMNRARLALVAGALAAFALAGCEHVKNQLLEPQNPGLVDPAAVGSSIASLALRVGAIGRYKQVQTGEGIWQSGGDLADEYMNSDFDASRINLDQRRTDPNIDMWGYGGITQSRGFVRDAIRSMLQYNPDSTALIGELYAELGVLRDDAGRQLLQWHSARPHDRRRHHVRCAADSARRCTTVRRRISTRR